MAPQHRPLEVAQGPRPGEGQELGLLRREGFVVAIGQPEPADHQLTETGQRCPVHHAVVLAHDADVLVALGVDEPCIGSG
jgi:hypothetical protein